MTEVPNSEELKKKRRSTRVKQAVPIIVSGSDALGRRFREHTVTSSVNCHGCKFLSKHYLLTGTKIELEVPSPHPDGKPRKVGARVAWTERPKSLTEPFQVGVELDTPGNIWGLEFPPEDWFPFPGDEPTARPAEAPARPALRVVERPAVSTPPAAPEEKPETEEEITLLVSEEKPASTEPGAPASNSLDVLQSALEEARAEIERVARKHADELRTQWHTELEAELDTWTARLEPRIAAAIERAVAEAESRVAQQAESARAVLDQAQDQVEAVLSQFEARLAQAVQAALTETEAALHQRTERTRAALEQQGQHLEQQASRVQQSLATATTHAEAVLAELARRAAAAEAAQQQTLNELQQQIAGWVAEHHARLEQTAGAMLERLASKLESSAERIAPQLAERLLAGLEQQVNAQLTRLQQALAQLEDTSRSADALLEQRRQQLAAEVEQLTAPHFARVHEMIGRLTDAEQRAHRVWEEQQAGLATLAAKVVENAQAGLRAEIERHLENQSDVIREKLSRHINELDEKITELTHTGYEGLLKASEWYQKKARAGMEAALKQRLEQAGVELRAQAADLSQRFTAELERHSRGFVEHTREVLQGESQAATETFQTQLGESSSQVLAEFHQQIKSVAEAQALLFTEELARQAQQQQEQTTRAAEQAVREFQQRLQQEQQELLTQTAEAAREQLNRARAAILGEMEATAEGLRQTWLESLQQDAEQSLTDYRARLENTTNAWLLTSAARLNEHTEALLAEMQQKIAERLRAAVREAMSRMLDSLTG